MNHLCFVLMPFGKKQHELGHVIDFDAVYKDMIAPAIAAANLEPIRADEERVGGAIHKPMFERLLLCEYAVADLTGANPNVYYELGVRHARRPHSTVLLFCEGTKLPFDIALLRGMFYSVDEKGAPSAAAKSATGAAITEQLREMRNNPHDDSPVYQLIGDLSRDQVGHESTDIFRKQAEYAREVKDKLAVARDKSEGALAAIEKIAAKPEMQLLNEVETGVIIDLMLSYRAVSAWDKLIELYQRMPKPLQLTTMVQEQYALALNRARRGDEAERVLVNLIKERGPSSETNGILGRIYKDRWDAAQKANEKFRAAGELKKAVDAYMAGFEADWRDPYPGVNACTLMEMQDKPDPRQKEILPVVRYAALRRAQRPTADYWDQATMLELAVLAGDQDDAFAWTGNAVAAVREGWEAETTKRNLAMIRECRAARGADAAWIAEVENELQKAADRKNSGG
ncbi:MAG TPA: TRAFs-binding domain-containing protein [Stellaceae bacterium]|nr:TRAFs-binding domain-containing protein [Stellaceae bacterium]